MKAEMEETYERFTNAMEWGRLAEAEQEGIRLLALIRDKLAKSAAADSGPGEAKAESCEFCPADGGGCNVCD